VADLDAKKRTATMMPATRDAISKLFSQPGRVCLERDAEGTFWAGLGLGGRFRVFPGKTVSAAVDRALAEAAPAPELRLATAERAP
jgi:hypothetical protein